VKAIYRRLQTRLRLAFGARETPSRVAAALALGVTISFSPFQGLHTLIALLLAFALKLNKPDVLLGTLVINPWTLTLYFPAACWLGSRLTGIPMPRLALPSPRTLLHHLTSPSLEPWVRDVLLIWGVGATLCTLAVGPTTFWLLRRFITRHRARHPHPPS
jgi:uncharacterized protein (DUF2062 family)